MIRSQWRRLTAVALPLLLLFTSCGSSGNNGGGGGGGNTQTRSFRMGTSPFFATHTAFPDFVFENLGDKDILSLHVDDFWGVPWTQCAGAGCTNLPANWVAQWTQLAQQAKAAGKPIYLTVSPLTNRRALSGSVQADGSVQTNWLAANLIDANGCYLFTDDPNAAGYATAYTNYVEYLINLIQPDYLSPDAEMNMQFTNCPSQKTAFINWYTGVHQSLKAAHASLPIFPTFQMEYMYGVATTSAACTAGTSLNDCFSERLNEALAIPGDRIAFSTYPSAWVYSSAFNNWMPTETFQMVAAATTRKIWISETGWNTVPVLNSYQHASGGTCSTSYLYPATLSTPQGTVDLGDNAAQTKYMTWLLGQAESNKLETVIWWLNRDYLDGTAAATCPCSPSTGDTCTLSDTFYQIGGTTDEQLLRIFGNMALRNYDGTPRPSYAVWQQYLGYTYKP